MSSLFDQSSESSALAGRPGAEDGSAGVTDDATFDLFGADAPPPAAITETATMSLCGDAGETTAQTSATPATAEAGASGTPAVATPAARVSVEPTWREVLARQLVAPSAPLPRGPFLPTARALLPAFEAAADWDTVATPGHLAMYHALVYWRHFSPHDGPALDRAVRQLGRQHASRDLAHIRVIGNGRLDALDRMWETARTCYEQRSTLAAQGPRHAAYADGALDAAAHVMSRYFLADEHLVAIERRVARQVQGVDSPDALLELARAHALTCLADPRAGVDATGRFAGNAQYLMASLGYVNALRDAAVDLARTQQTPLAAAVLDVYQGLTAPVLAPSEIAAPEDQSPVATPEQRADAFRRCLAALYLVPASSVNPYHVLPEDAFHVGATVLPTAAAPETAPTAGTSTARPRMTEAIEEIAGDDAPAAAASSPASAAVPADGGTPIHDPFVLPDAPLAIDTAARAALSPAAAAPGVTPTQVIAAAPRDAASTPARVVGVSSVVTLRDLTTTAADTAAPHAVTRVMPATSAPVVEPTPAPAPVMPETTATTARGGPADWRAALRGRVTAGV